MSDLVGNPEDRFSRVEAQMLMFNPFMTNGPAHHYHLGVSTVIIRGFKSDCKFLLKFSI